MRVPIQNRFLALQVRLTKRYCLTLEGLALLVIGLTVIGFKLRKVHDAYFIKTEFTVMMVIGLLFFGFFLVLVFVKDRGIVVGANWVMLILCNILAFLRY